MVDLSKASEAKEFFKAVIDKLSGSNITGVYTSECGIGIYSGGRSYICDEAVYIGFENALYLIIEYYFIDGLYAELRPLDDKEKNYVENALPSDLFNRSDKLFDDVNETSKLEYGELSSVELANVIGDYSKWIDGNIEYIKPSEETFSEITFKMSNGKSFTLSPSEAEQDGYINLWSNEAEIRISWEKEDVM